MSQVLIRRALEKRLSAMSPALETAYENAAFTPVVGAPYQKVNLLPATPDNSIQGSTTYFERGIFQVMLLYPINTGANAAESHAELVKAQFKRGTSMTESGVTVNVITSPRLAPALVDGDRYCLPISITYQAQVIVP